MTDTPGIERVPAWQCIGCGKIEATQPCIGVCRDRRVEFVYASEHDAAMQRERAAAHQRLEALAAIVRQIAWTTPREGECERSYRALQARARQLVRSLAKGDAALDALLQPADTPPTA
jgi:hypothetical protein